MSVIMKGAEVAAAMKVKLVAEMELLRQKNINPCLGIIRVGARPEDLSYERGARKRMESIGIGCEVLELPEQITQVDFEDNFRRINDNPSVHGILLFRPLPAHLDEEPVKAMIHPWKDVDCMCAANMAKVFSGDETGYAPCTPEAVMEMLDYYQIDPQGEKVTVISRSMVVGKPLAMMLLKRHATVTVCHSKTNNLLEVCRDAQILVAAAGQIRMVTADMVGKDAVVADVGINVDAAGKLCGDVDFEKISAQASYISPVPGGVGGITTSVLAKHVIRAAAHVNE